MIALIELWNSFKSTEFIPAIIIIMIFFYINNSIRIDALERRITELEKRK